MEENAYNSCVLIFQSFLNFALLLYIGLKWAKYYGIPDNFPPGPPCVPLLGVLPFIKGDFRTALQEWQDIYGSMVGTKLGNELAVIISDFDVISTAFNDERCTGRPKNLRKIMHAFFASQKSEEGSAQGSFESIFKRRSLEERPTFTSSGIVFAHGPDWVEQRRFSLRTLRDRGFGKSAMEHAVLTEIEKFFEVVEKQLKNEEDQQSSCDLNKDLSVAVVNSLWSILTGQKIAHGDKRVRKIYEHFEQCYLKNDQPTSLVGHDQYSIGRSLLFPHTNTAI